MDSYLCELNESRILNRGLTVSKTPFEARLGINYNKRTKGRLIFRGAKTFFIDNRYRVRLLFAAKYKMSILDLGPVIFSSIEEQIEWFQRHNLLATRRECPACHVDMEMQLRSDIQDKYR